MSSRIHPVAARGFADVGDVYERSRPAYPPDAVATLFRVTGVGPGTDVVELGPGTGKLTRLIVAAGARVVAVEPVRGMRRKLAQAVPGVRVVDGTAEATTLPSASAGAVLAAQAFHWFDGEAALAETHRVLRPGGTLGLMWAIRDESVPWVAELSRLIEPYEGDVPRYRRMGWRSAFEETALFSPLQETQLRYDQEMDPRRLADRLSSMSFIAVLDEEERERLLRRAGELVSPLGNRFLLPHVVDVFWCTRR